MKKILFIIFLLFVCLNLFSQNYNYGLTQNDLNLLLGQYVPNAETSKYNWVLQFFSWGRQTAISINGDVILIDYNNNMAERLGSEYKGYLILSEPGVAFLISNIEKLADNKFVLSLVSLANLGSRPPKYAGQITITFLDNIHIVIDTTDFLLNGFNYMILWKSAGPTVTVKNKMNYLQLPDYQRIQR